MKKFLLVLSLLLALSLLGGCGKSQTEPPITHEAPTSATEAPTTTPAVETDSTPSAATPPAETEGDASSDSIAAVYDQQIQRYYEALSNHWDESAYFDHEMSSLAAYYYDGNALDNIGFAFMDLDADNVQELIIGAIQNAERDPLVFEIWTLNNGQPVMLAQSGSRNRYYMQYTQEDDLWSVAYEAENGAANHAVYYLHLTEGVFEVTQGILFDAVASENAPWFMTYDLNWDISDDMPIDEETANAVMEAEWNRYTEVEYLPYSLYK